MSPLSTASGVFRSLKQSANRHRAASRPGKLTVEVLEDRLAPSITINLTNNFGLDTSTYGVWASGWAGAGSPNLYVLQPDGDFAVPTGSSGTIPVISLSDLPSINLDATINNLSARLTFWVSTLDQPPAGATFSGTNVTPPPTPPYAAGTTNVTPPSDIVEFTYTSGQNSTIDLSAVNGFGIPLTLSGATTSGPTTIGTQSGSTFNRAAIGTAYTAFMSNDPEGAAFAKLLYNSAVTFNTTSIAASPTGATETGNTVTITTTTPHGLNAGEGVTVAGVAVGGYNGTFTVAGTPSSTTFLYAAPTTGLPASGGGTASRTIYETPPFLIDGQYYVIADPSDWLANQPATAANDPLADYWDSTLNRFFQKGNFVSVNLSAGAPNTYSGESAVGATESGSTVTITTTAAHGLGVGDSVTIAGVAVAGYNGTFTVATVPTTNSFTYTNAPTGLAESGGGTVTGPSTSAAIAPLGGMYTLSNGSNTFMFPHPGTGLTGAQYVFGQAFGPLTPSGSGGDAGLLQDNIWQALCRGVALDGVSTTSITNAESTTAWNANASGTTGAVTTFEWYTQHTPSAFSGFTSVYDAFAKFLHYSDINGADCRSGPTTPIFVGNAAYGFSEDENPNGPYSVATQGEVPSKFDGTVADGTTLTLTIQPWVAAAPSQPVVSGLSISGGATSGGTSVTVNGTGFSGATEVKFGSTLATINTISSTSISVTAPAHVAGTVDVTVETPGGTSATSAADHFTFQAAPTVTGLSVGAGPTSGNTPLTIHGTGFTGTTAVSFGGTPATINSLSSTSITVTSPAHAAGTVDVIVTTPGGPSATSAADQFSYSDATPMLSFAQQPLFSFVGLAISPAVVVQVQDQFSNLQAGNSGTATLALNSGPAGAVLSGTKTVSVVNGTATFANLTLNKPGTYTFVATSASLTPAVSASFNVSATTTFSMTVVNPPDPSKPLTVPAGQFQVLVKALVGTSVDPTYRGTVHFTSTDLKAVLPADYTFTATDAGQHTFTVTLGTAGTRSITVADTRKSTVKLTKSFSVVHGPVSGFSVTGYPAFVYAGTAKPFTVRAVDGFGNRVTSYQGIVTLNSSDPLAVGVAPLPAAFNGAQVVFNAANAGSRTFSVKLNTTTGLQSLAATAGSLTGSQTGISVFKLAPTISGPANGVPFQPLSYTLGAVQGTPPPTAKFSHIINWGDGTPVQVVSGGATVKVLHTFKKTSPIAPGHFTITLKVSNGVNPSPAPATKQVTIHKSVLDTDPANPLNTALFVGGTTGNDTILISPANAAGTDLTVSINGTPEPGTFSPTGNVYVFSGDGNDTVNLQAALIGGTPVSVGVPIVIDGGAGNDNLSAQGSQAGTLLLGGLGNDTLLGGLARDLLIGGAGADKLQVGTGAAILIGATTAFDDNEATLAAVLAEWSSPGAYADRVNHLLGIGTGLNGLFTLTPTTVKSDASIDSLFGGAGLDWFFITGNGVVDLFSGFVNGEQATIL